MYLEAIVGNNMVFKITLYIDDIDKNASTFHFPISIISILYHIILLHGNTLFFSPLCFVLFYFISFYFA